ncbi:hypothetical protein SteCoe_5510 [Stentor coeruleus]|uniref:G-protein coupled receptors family 2 profile 2 domain-containing protein n=1 Tax=Stentor coeruleus TaxID=5963 RepID=A0A1R2CS80_9CILI|nr:hypothetical protein SteCoe_5510 [Stentor coeruleus]
MSDDSKYDYSLDDQNKIFIGNAAAGSLSIMGCTFIIVIFFSYPSLRKLPFRLIFYLTIADLGNSIGTIMPYMNGNIYCQIQGYFVSYFGLSSILWCAFIAHAINVAIISQQKIDKYEKIYLFLGYIMPLLTFLVLIHKEYEVSLGVCWIKQTNKLNNEHNIEIILRMITYYIPLLIILIYVCAQHIRVIFAIKRSDVLEEDSKKISLILIMKLKIYPMIMVMFLLPITIIRLTSFSATPRWSLTLLADVGVGLNGFINSIVYGLTQEVRNELSKTFCKRKEIELLTIEDQSELENE